MFLDLHVHTNRYSACSILSPEDMLNAANLLKLDGLVIVEHGLIWDKEEVLELKKHPKAKDLVILRGQEIRVYSKNRLAGDILVFGVERIIDEQLSLQELIQLVKNEGGATVAAHPYRFGYGIGDDVYKFEFDGIEVLNGNTSPEGMQQALDAQKILQIAGTGGSDAHSADAVGNYLTYFSDAITTEAQLVSAIKQKKCRPAYYEEISLLKRS